MLGNRTRFSKDLLIRQLWITNKWVLFRSSNCRISEINSHKNIFLKNLENFVISRMKVLHSSIIVSSRVISIVLTIIKNKFKIRLFTRAMTKLKVIFINQIKKSRRLKLFHPIFLNSMSRLITIIECLISQIIKLSPKMSKLTKLKKLTPISIIIRPVFNKNKCNHHRQVTWTIRTLVTRMNVTTIMKTCIMKNRMRMRWIMTLINNMMIIKITRMKKQ